MSATDELRRLLDERGAEWTKPNNEAANYLTSWRVGIMHINAMEFRDGVLTVTSCAEDVTPEQAIDATLGSCNCTNDCTNDCTNSERTGMCQKVYLVETGDDLIEGWYPIGVYLNSKAAEDCAESLRGEVDGIRLFARVVELKVMADG